MKQSKTWGIRGYLQRDNKAAAHENNVGEYYDG
jgi:hypothetical protein